jgi:hypothetical protein
MRTACASVKGTALLGSVSPRGSSGAVGGHFLTLASSCASGIVATWLSRVAVGVNRGAQLVRRGLALVGYIGCFYR